MTETMKERIVPVLLCGGSGTRLWPLSRKSFPKQFVPFVGEDTLFQSSAKRLSGEIFDTPLVLTNEDFRFVVQEQLNACNIQNQGILIEPEARNTAPAILAAALYLAKTSPDALMLVAPSDHVISDAPAFEQAVLAGCQAALKGDLVTFGIKPTYPETGYGYLDLSSAPADGDLTPIRLNRFIEKPDAEKAEKLVATGNHMWNAGIFLFSVKSILEAYDAYAPDMVPPIQASVDKALRDLHFLRLEGDAWSKAEATSIDYAIMEQADNISVVPFSAGWSDLGGWDAVLRETGPGGRAKRPRHCDRLFGYAAEVGRQRAGTCRYRPEECYRCCDAGCRFGRRCLPRAGCQSCRCGIEKKGRPTGRTIPPRPSSLGIIRMYRLG